MSTRIIKINRGDSYELTTVIPSKENPINNYKLTVNDALYFALLMPHQKFEDAVLIKGYTHEDQNDDGEITIRLSARETRNLMPGIYYYTTKLQRGGTLEAIGDDDDPDEVRTIIERTKFIVND
jgi:hypothetical protein